MDARLAERSSNSPQGRFFLVCRHLASEIDEMCYIMLTSQVLRSTTEHSIIFSILENNCVVCIMCSEGYPSSVRRPLRTLFENVCFFCVDLGFPASLGCWLVICLQFCLVGCVVSWLPGYMAGLLAC